MNVITEERSELSPTVLQAVPTMGIFASIQGAESSPTWLERAFDFLKTLDFATLVFALTAVGVTAMGLTPVLVAREITAAGAVIPCVGIVVLGAIGFTAINKTNRESRGTNRKDNPYKPIDTRLT